MKKNTIVGITFDATMNIKDATNSVEEIGRHFETLRKQMPQGLSKRFKSDLEELEAEMKSFKDISSDLETLGDISALEDSSKKIAKLYKKIKEEGSEIADLDLDSLMPKEILEKLASASKLTKAYKKDINALSDETEDYKKKIQDLINLKKEHQELARKKTAIGKTSVSDEDLVAAEQQKIKLGRDVDNAKLKGSGIDLSGKEFQTLLKQQREAVSAYADLQDKAKQYKKALLEVENELENNEKAQKKYQEVSEKFGTTLKALENSLSNLGEDLKIEKFNKFKEELKEITDLDLSELKQDLSNLEEILGSLSAEQMEKISLAVEGLTENTKKLDKPLKDMEEGVGGVVKEGEKIGTLSDEVDRLKNQVIDFFSIGNAIELFKRAISSAFETVKELDKTMTETAVVTDFTVGDMWKQLPLYSKNARDLGVSINAAYEATTLYYQQGLKTEEAMGVSNETLRMARIANIDAKDATDLMTAALRGFNMEVNAMNAQKVNDVFSKLAAVTAADTEEIGIAMSKTASIAESANMEFNTTAALLTQIIETTREAPETAGTAMKTIIARFTEVKKLMTAGQLTGTDEEGEVIDVNKIDTALKTVGLSLKGFMQGTEGIDDIFLKLAEKWEGLDISTQRYIATMAAGSRQQSRFLAMMGDYGRTMELVDAANTSAGASQEQFNKTLESMDAKLNKMKVAWDTFAMGIGNNEIIKFFTDLLTGLLNTINGIINALSFDNGLIKSVLSLTAAILGLKVGFRIFNSLFDAIKESKGEAILKTLITNLKKTKAEAAVAGAATNKFSLSLIKEGLASTGATIATKAFGKAALSTAAQVGIALGAIGLLIGAITLLIFGLKKLYEKMREKTPEGKLEAAKKDAEAAAEAAQEAGDAYDNLNDSLTSLEEKYADINKLTEGTREWTRSMQELNSEVLDLVDKYPKLARLVENKGGVLTLDIASKDVQKIIDEYEKEKRKTSITETATSGIEKKAQRDVEQKDLLKEIHKSSKYSLSDELIEVVADQIARGELIGEEIDKFFSDRRINHVSEEAIAGMREYGESVLQEQAESSDYFSNLVLQLESLDFRGQLDAKSVKFNEGIIKDETSTEAGILKRTLLDSGITEEIINKNGGWESFVGQLYEAEVDFLTLAIAREEKALDNLPGKFKNLKNLVSKDIDVIENLGSQVSVMGDDAGEDYLESFNEVLRGAKDPKALAAYLSTIDPTNMNEITAAMEYMRTQGVDSSQIENFWNKITDGAGTYIDSLESILSLIDKWNKEQLNVEGIGSRLKEGKASTEDMLELTKAGVDLTDFDMTPEGWVGTEEAIKKATDALQDYYDLNQKRVLEQEREQAARNAGNISDGIDKRGDSFAVGNTGLGANTAEGKQLTTVNKTTGKLVAGQVDMGVSESVRTALAGAGITVADKSAEETVDEFLSRLQEAYNSYISLLNNKEDIDIMIAKFEEMKAEQEKIDQMKLSSAENISNGASEEIILGSLEREIGEEGFNTDEVKAYAKELIKANEKLGNTSEALDKVSALQSAFASTKSQKGLKEIVDSYDDWNSILDETTGLLKDTSTEGRATFDKFKASVSEMLNTSVDLSDEFWNNSENIKLIRDAANGSVEALSQLRQAATDDFLIQIQTEFKSKEAVAEIEEFRIWLAGYKLPDLEAGAVLDDTYFIKALNNMIEQAGLTTDQVQALVTQMGFTAKIDLVQKHVPGYVQTSPANTLGKRFGNTKPIKTTIPGYTYSTPQVSIMTKNASPYRAPSRGGGGGSKGGSKGGGGGGGGGGSSSGGGGDSSKPKKDTWENPYDDLYNLSEKVNKTIRDRNSLEREYDMILEDRTSSINELLANSLKQLANLRKEKALQGDILKTYQKRLKGAASQEYLGTKTVGDEEEQFWTTFQREATRLGLGSLSSYASVNSETAEITIDYSKIEAIENNTTKGETQGALLTAFISFLEETASSLIDTKETLLDISDQIDEIEKRGKEEYIEFEQSIYDAIVEREQAIIDEYQSLSEVISDSNSKILDSLQESISLERQIRDNTDTEENISDMESRLAYLRRDTSGANDAEIRQLEKDLSDARESYSDTLVDQELQRLSDVNEKAAEQRERQIELMQSQLDYAASNGAFWEEVSRMLESSINADGTLKTTSELVDLLKVTDEFKALSYFGGKVWIDDLIQAWLVALEGKANLEEEYKTTPATTTPTTTKPTTTAPTTTTPTTSAPVQEVYTVKSGDTLSGIASTYNKKGFNTTYQKIGKDNAITNLNRIYAGQKLTIKKYKEGGLVDYTGPAWVDGTPGKPEAMLRAVDTQNFIELKEILADILKNPSKGSSKPSGDNYFDVDINVDSIANDYDVEKMASKVKEIINTDARYRNVNSINFLR